MPSISDFARRVPHDSALPHTKRYSSEVIADRMIAEALNNHWQARMRYYVEVRASVAAVSGEVQHG